MFSLKGSSVHLPRLDRLSFQTVCRCKGLRRVINSSNHRCLNRCERGRIWLSKKATRSRYKPGGGCTAWVRGGENSDYGIGKKMTKQLEETISSFSSFLCTGRINFFPTVSVFSCWLKHSRTEPAIRHEERRARRIEKERMEQGRWGGGAKSRRAK